MGDPWTSAPAAIGMDNSTNTFKIARNTNGNLSSLTHLEISSSGEEVTISAGDLVFGTAGKGICLGVTTNTDANTLDDYEEGTFTPSASNLSSATGSYTKIGNKVHCKAYVAANGATGIDFTGIPFTASGAAGYGAGGGIVTYQSQNSTEAWQVHTNVIPVGYSM